MTKMKNLSQFLAKGIQQKFLTNPSHQDLIKSMERLNAATLDFHAQVNLYKADLATNLQMLFESYNTVFLRQFQVFFHTENKKEKLYETKLEQLKH